VSTCLKRARRESDYATSGSGGTSSRIRCSPEQPRRPILAVRPAIPIASPAALPCHRLADRAFPAPVAVVDNRVAQASHPVTMSSGGRRVPRSSSTKRSCARCSRRLVLRELSAVGVVNVMLMGVWRLRDGTEDAEGNQSQSGASETNRGPRRREWSYFRTAASSGTS
jgi:hypothetical protein